MENAVVVKDVWKMLGYKWVLKQVSLNIPKGVLAFLFGPNGAGKSTFLKMVGGLWRPTNGDIKVLGLNPLSSEAKHLLGIVLHENTLYDELSVSENLSFYRKFYKSDGARFEAIVELLGIDRVLNKKIRELSFGWRRRVNIARALINSPEVFIVDEPLTGLDKGGRRAIVDILNEIIGRGGTVIAAAPSVEKEVIEGVNSVVYRVGDYTIKRCDDLDEHH